MSDPNGLNTKVAQVIDEIADELIRLTTLGSKIDAIRGASELTLESLDSRLSSIEDGIASLGTQLGDVLGSREEGNLNTVWIFLDELSTRLQSVEGNIGFPTGDATTTVLGRLAAIERLSRCACPPEPPDLDDAETGCATPYISIPAFTRVVGAYPGRVFAGWDDPAPEGLLLTNWLAEPVPPAELVRSTDLSGWRIYVQSEARLFSLNPTGPTLLPTNVWISIDAYDEHLAVSVLDPNDITAYICVPVSAEWVDCVTIDSVAATYSTDAPFSLDLQAIPFDTVPNVDKTDHWFGGGNEQEINVANTAITTNMNGVRVELVSGGPVTIAIIDSSGGGGSYPLGAPTDQQTIDVDTTLFVIGNFSASSPSTHPFTVEICPPGS